MGGKFRVLMNLAASPPFFHKRCSMGDSEADEYGTVRLKQLKYKQISYGHVSTASKTRMKIFVVHANNLVVVVGVVPVIKCVYPVLSFFINFYFSFSSRSKKKEPQSGSSVLGLSLLITLSNAMVE